MTRITLRFLPSSKPATDQEVTMKMQNYLWENMIQQNRVVSVNEYETYEWDHDSQERRNFHYIAMWIR